MHRIFSFVFLQNYRSVGIRSPIFFSPETEFTTIAHANAHSQFQCKNLEKSISILKTKKIVVQNIDSNSFSVSG